MKDSIVITMIGAESTSFLKLWGVMPASVLMAIIYVKLIMTFRAQTVFYIILSSFLMFFALFSFFLISHYLKNQIDFYLKDFHHYTNFQFI